MVPRLFPWASVRLPYLPRQHSGQISPNKNLSFPCTTAAFTLSPVPEGLHLMLTRPRTVPSMRFLSVGSHFCARASFRHPLAGLPLPSASGYMGPIPNTTGAPTGDLHPISSCPCRTYTRRCTRTAIPLRPIAVGELGRYKRRYSWETNLVTTQES